MNHKEIKEDNQVKIKFAATIKSTNLRKDNEIKWIRSTSKTIKSNSAVIQYWLILKEK